VHPEDRQKFIDAVIPDMTAAQKIPGCIFYAFAQDLTDPTAFHLSEGWSDRAAYERHESSETFRSALATVVDTVRILHREGMRYVVDKQDIDDPRDSDTSQ
jgi:quinol monooxygenase YgiN